MTVMDTRSATSVYYQNVRGLRTKASEFFANVVASCFRHNLPKETWLCQDLSDSLYFTDRYTVFRRDRNYEATRQMFGGGVLTAVSGAVKATRRHDLETYDECVWVEIQANRCSYLIGNYYFPPKFDSSSFITHFSKTI